MGKSAALLRAWLLLATVAMLPAAGCDRNVGKNKTGPRTFRLSVGSNNQQAAGTSDTFSILPDGSLVCFASTANNISTDPSAFKEIFVKHRDTGAVENVTKLSTVFAQSGLDDCHNPSISPDGVNIAFESKGSLNGSFATPQATKNIWMATRTGPPAGLQAIVLGTPTGWPDNDCVNPSIAVDSLARKWIVYTSFATNIVGLPVFANSHAGGTSVVYITNAAAAYNMAIVSHPAASGNNTFPASGNSRDGILSANGAFVAFASKSDLTTAGTALEQIYRYDTATGAVQLVSEFPGGPPNTPANGDCFRPSISADGRFVCFHTLAVNLGADGSGTNALIVVRDMNGSAITPVADQATFLNFGGNKLGFRIGMSDDARFFAHSFRPTSATLAQIQYVDVLGGSKMVSQSPAGQPGDNFSLSPALSLEGRWAFWVSSATNLVLDDTNSAFDVFGHGPLQ
jgi:WD40 repeat protein